MKPQTNRHLQRLFLILVSFCCLITLEGIFTPIHLFPRTQKVKAKTNSVSTLTPDIIRQLKEMKPVRLLVELNSKDIRNKAERIRRKNHLLFDNLEIRALKQNAYSKQQKRLLKGMQSNYIKIIHSYKNLPYLLIELKNYASLSNLLNQPDVYGVYEIHRFKSLFDKDLELIGQPEIATSGYIGSGTSVVIIDSGVHGSEPEFGDCPSQDNPSCCRILLDIELASLAPPGLFVDTECEGDNHGTYVADVIAREAPGVNIISLDHTVLSGFWVEECQPEEVLILQGLDWTLEHKDEYSIVAVNMSFALTTSSGDELIYTETTSPTDWNTILQDLRDSGIMPIAAAGNKGASTGLAFPACSPYVVSVGTVYPSFDKIDEVHSNTYDLLDLLAPGWDGGGCTSIAAPHVTAAWAILRAAFPTQSLEETLTTLKETGKPILDSRVMKWFPRIQLDAALSLTDIVKGQIEPEDRFGHALIAGDFNRDGYTDLAVGTPGQEVQGQKGAGAVNILYGAGNGFQSNHNEILYVGRAVGGRTVSGYPEGNAGFGTALAIGDFNGDRYMDLAVGAPKTAGSIVESSSYTRRVYESGKVYVFWGAASGLLGYWTEFWTRSNIIDAGNPIDGDHFGASLASGDFNDDGYADLAIGAPDEARQDVSPKVGAVHILYGTPDGLFNSGSQTFHQDDDDSHLAEPVSFGYPGDQFGASLAVGDFDGNGCDDLAIGAPKRRVQTEQTGEERKAGSFTILYGFSGSVLSTAGTKEWSQELLSANGSFQGAGYSNQNDMFAYALVAGDLTNDGIDDLVVGVTGDDPCGYESAGLVEVLTQRASQPREFGRVGLFYEAQADNFWCGGRLPGLIHNLELLGWTMAVGDFRNSGILGLAIGVPLDRCGEIAVGCVDVIYIGYGNYPVEKWYRKDPSIPSSERVRLYRTAAEGDQFGHALASGDFNGDGFSDLAIGVPGANGMRSLREFRDGCEKPDAIADNSGEVDVIFGTSQGLFSATEECSPAPCFGSQDPPGARCAITLSQGTSPQTLCPKTVSVSVEPN